MLWGWMDGMILIKMHFQLAWTPFITNARRQYVSISWPWWPLTLTSSFNGHCYFAIQEAWLFHPYSSLFVFSSGNDWCGCVFWPWWPLTFIPMIFLGSLIFQHRTLMIIFCCSCISRSENEKKCFSWRRSRSKFKVIFMSRSLDVLYLLSIEYAWSLSSYWCQFFAFSYYTNK